MCCDWLNKKQNIFHISDNLQYNTLGRLVDSHPPSVWWSKYNFDRLKIKLWVAGLDLRHSRVFIFILVNLQKTKNKLKGFCKEFCKKLWIKNNTWNIRHLFNETIIPATQQPSVLYWRLSDFVLWLYDSAMVRKQ